MTAAGTQLTPSLLQHVTIMVKVIKIQNYTLYALLLLLGLTRLIQYKSVKLHIWLEKTT